MTQVVPVFQTHDLLKLLRQSLDGLLQTGGQFLVRELVAVRGSPSWQLIAKAAGFACVTCRAHVRFENLFAFPTAFEGDDSVVQDGSQPRINQATAWIPGGGTAFGLRYGEQHIADQLFGDFPSNIFLPGLVDKLLAVSPIKFSERFGVPSVILLQQFFGGHFGE